jgi:hypothetical protein
MALLDVKQLYVKLVALTLAKPPYYFHRKGYGDFQIRYIETNPRESSISVIGRHAKESYSYEFTAVFRDRKTDEDLTFFRMASFEQCFAFAQKKIKTNSISPRILSLIFSYAKRPTKHNV